MRNEKFQLIQQKKEHVFQLVSICIHHLINLFLTRAPITILIAILISSPAQAAFVTERSFASPDGKLTFILERDDTNNRLHWSVNRAGAAIVTRGALGIDLAKVGTIADEGTISHVETREVDTKWTPPFGENSLIRDHFREETLTLTHADHGAQAVKLQVRAYDEGIAFRYLVNGAGTLTMSGEKTSYPLPDSAVVWVVPASQGPISNQNKKYRLELFSDDASAATPTQVRIDSSQIKRGHVINLAVAARNGFSAILTPE